MIDETMGQHPRSRPTGALDLLRVERIDHGVRCIEDAALVDRLALEEKWKNRCSLLALLSFIMPVGLILRGMTDGAMLFAPVALIGALCFLLSAAVMIKGAVSGKQALHE